MYYSVPNKRTGYAVFYFLRFAVGMAWVRSRYFLRLAGGMFIWSGYEFWLLIARYENRYIRPFLKWNEWYLRIIVVQNKLEVDFCNTHISKLSEKLRIAVFKWYIQWYLMEFKDLSGGTFFCRGMILLRNSRHDQGVCLFG